MTATDKLHRMWDKLHRMWDKRGVEWDKLHRMWDKRGVEWDKLGRWTCHNAAPTYLDFLCSECGFVHYHSDVNDAGDGNGWRYCPNCGAKVVDDASVD